MTELEQYVHSYFSVTGEDMSEIASHYGRIHLRQLLFAHSSFDRMLGYGLKYNDSFNHTSLGWTGKKEPRR